MKEFTITAPDGLKLSAALFECENPKALIQVIHGAKEHKERYYDFINFLNSNGYAVIVSDNRGHGHSVNTKYFLGHFDGIMQVVDDQLLVTQYIKNIYPGKDLYIFGHSLGSCIARIYLQKHDDEVKKMVLTGTVLPISICKLGDAVCDIFMKKYGRNSIAGVLSKMVNADVDSWVCANPATMAVYRRDMLVKRCTYTNAAIASIVQADEFMTDYDKFKLKNPSLKILSANGAQDVCMGTPLGLKSSIRALHKIGYKDVQGIIYPGMKHEVINEADNAKVYSDILNFYNA